MNPTTAKLPIGLAEQAKIYHLEGKSTRALLYLREALQQSERSGQSALLARYYSQLSLEVLEQQGHYEDVIAYCDQAIEHYREHPPQSPVARKDLAEAWQRRGVCELRLGNHESACTSLRQAMETSAGASTLPLARTLHDWMQRRFQIDNHKLTRLLEQQHYYSIRPDTVERERALKMPHLDSIAV